MKTRINSRWWSHKLNTPLHCFKSNKRKQQENSPQRIIQVIYWSSNTLAQTKETPTYVPHIYAGHDRVRTSPSSWPSGKLRSISTSGCRSQVQMGIPWPMPGNYPVCVGPRDAWIQGIIRESGQSLSASLQKKQIRNSAEASNTISLPQDIGNSFIIRGNFMCSTEVQDRILVYSINS